MGCTSSISTTTNIHAKKKNSDETSTERRNRIRRECRTRIKERVAEGGDAEEIEREENERARVEIAKPIWEAQPIIHRKSNKFSTLNGSKHHHKQKQKYQIKEEQQQSLHTQEEQREPDMDQPHQQHQQHQQQPPIMEEDEEEEGPPLLTPDGLIVLDEIELWSPEEQESAAIEDMRNSVFTSHLPIEVVDAIGRSLVLTRYPPCHVIYYTDQDADMFYIIRAGAVCIQVDPSHQADKERQPPPVDEQGNIIINDHDLNTLAIKQRGDLFGIETLASTPRARRTIASAYTDCLCWALHRNDINKLIQQYPESKDILVTCLSEQIESCLSQCSYLQGIPPYDISILAALVQYKHIDQDQIIFEEGDAPEITGNCLFIIFAGQVDILIKEDGTSRTTKSLGPSSMFGEVGLIMDLPRTATVVSKTSCLLLELAQTSFRNFVILAPSILTRFKDQVEAHHINAQYLLDNSIIVDFFVQFCEKEFSTENVEFWLEALRFRRTQFPGSFELTQAAQSIYDTYIDRSATKQVNLKSQILNHISDSIHTRTNMNNDIFIDAEKEILLLMTSDSFFRFKSSQLFARCLEHINAPYVLPPRPVPEEIPGNASSAIRPVTVNPSQHRASITMITQQSSRRLLNTDEKEPYEEHVMTEEIKQGDTTTTIFLPTGSAPVTPSRQPEIAANGLPSDTDLAIAAAAVAPADASGIMF